MWWRSRTLDRRSLALAGLGLAVGAVNIARWRAAVPSETTVVSSAVGRPRVFPDDIDKWVIADALPAGIRVKSIESVGARRDRLRAEWTGDGRASIAYLSRLEARGVAAQRLRATLSAGKL